MSAADSGPEGNAIEIATPEQIAVSVEREVRKRSSPVTPSAAIALEVQRYLARRSAALEQQRSNLASAATQRSIEQGRQEAFYFSPTYRDLTPRPNAQPLFTPTHYFEVPDGKPKTTVPKVGPATAKPEPIPPKDRIELTSPEGVRYLVDRTLDFFGVGEQDRQKITGDPTDLSYTDPLFIPSLIVQLYELAAGIVSTSQDEGESIGKGAYEFVQDTKDKPLSEWTIEEILKGLGLAGAAILVGKAGAARAVIAILRKLIASSLAAGGSSAGSLWGGLLSGLGFGLGTRTTGGVNIDIPDPNDGGTDGNSDDGTEEPDPLGDEEQPGEGYDPSLGFSVPPPVIITNYVTPTTDVPRAVRGFGRSGVGVSTRSSGLPDCVERVAAGLATPEEAADCMSKLKEYLKG
jgi:hypothetical protein